MIIFMSHFLPHLLNQNGFHEPSALSFFCSSMDKIRSRKNRSPMITIISITVGTAITPMLTIPIPYQYIAERFTQHRFDFANCG